MLSARTTLATAGVLMALAVILGAFGAHALKAQLSAAELAVYDTAVRYHFFNTLGLLCIGILQRDSFSRSLGLAGVMIFTGILLFSGSLYFLSFGAPRFVGIITPIGGLAFILGWLLFAWSTLRPQS